MKNISFVIPCYNSEATIEAVTTEIVSMMNSHKVDNYEIILVSDCSPDGVFSVICELADRNTHIKGIEFARNFGQHAALMAGYRTACGEIIVSLDDDGQAPLDGLFPMLDMLENGFDVVYGVHDNYTHGLFRYWGTKINDWMCCSLLGKPKDIAEDSFFVMKSFVKNEIIRYESSFPYMPGLVFRATKKIGNYKTVQRDRLKGKSNYTIGKLVGLLLNGFTAFSVKPLRVSTYMGAILAFCGFFWAIYTAVQKIINPSILEGYSSIMAALLFIGGIIMIMLGIIGEYIGRIYISINRSPQYVIYRTTFDKGQL